MNEQSTVFVVDDDATIRSGLTLLLESVGMRMRSYGSCGEFLEDYRGDEAGCLVLDVRMLGMTGLELQRELQARGWAIPVIMITGHGDVPMAVEAVKQGAVDFLEKPIREQVLLDAIQRALALDVKRRGREAALAQVRGKLAGLTPREEQVLSLVVEGKANKVIATNLGVSQKTVEFHRSHIMEKMGAESLAELVRQVGQVEHSQESGVRSEE